MTSQRSISLVIAAVAVFGPLWPTVAQEEDLSSELARYLRAAKQRTTQVVADKADALEGKVDAERQQRGASAPSSGAGSAPNTAEKGQQDQHLGKPDTPAQSDASAPVETEQPPASAPVAPTAETHIESGVPQVTWVPKDRMDAIMAALRQQNWGQLLPLLQQQSGYDSVLVVQHRKTEARRVDRETAARRLALAIERDAAILGVFEEGAPERVTIEARVQEAKQALAACEAEIRELGIEEGRLLQAACRAYLSQHSASWRVKSQND